MDAANSFALAVAAYVQALDSARTNRAEDRPVLEALVANAAGLLAQAVLGNFVVAVGRTETHERLRGQTWLQGVDMMELDRAWALVLSSVPKAPSNNSFKPKPLRGSA